jgi:predicted transposase/invertase (TIGR01784 family)
MGEIFSENLDLLDPVIRYLRNKGIEEGIEEGMEKGKLEIAKNLLQMEFSIDEIVGITGLSKEKILDAK